MAPEVGAGAHRKLGGGGSGEMTAVHVEWWRTTHRFIFISHFRSVTANSLLCFCLIRVHMSMLTQKEMAFPAR